MADQAVTTGEGRALRMLRIVQHVLFTAMVVLGVMRSGLDGGVSPGEALAAIALLGWYWLGWWSASRWPQPSSELWLGVLSGLCLAAVWVSGDFAWVSFAVFVAFATTLEPGPAVAAIVVLAAGTGAILIGRALGGAGRRSGGRRSCGRCPGWCRSDLSS